MDATVTVLSPVEADRRYEIGENIPAGAIPAGQIDELAAIGAVSVSVSADDRSDRIQRAMDSLGADDLTKDGRPALAALRAASGIEDVSAAERDREWKLRDEQVRDA